MCLASAVAVQLLCYALVLLNPACTARPARQSVLVQCVLRVRADCLVPLRLWAVRVCRLSLCATV